MVAIPKALAMAGLKLEEIGVIELNEAFAVQALAVIRRAGLDAARVNPNGGAVALGHPLGCTGAKLTATILPRNGAHRYALRHGDDVRGRRAGGCRNPRAPIEGITADSLRPARPGLWGPENMPAERGIATLSHALDRGAL